MKLLINKYNFRKYKTMHPNFKMIKMPKSLKMIKLWKRFQTTRKVKYLHLIMMSTGQT